MNTCWYNGYMNRYDKQITLRVDSNQYNKLITWKNHKFPDLTIPEFLRLIMNLAYACPGHNDLKIDTPRGEVDVVGEDAW